MFLLALIALSVLALLPLVAGVASADCATATGSKAAIRAAAEIAKRPDIGMPESVQTNHPVSLREARLANDTSSPSALAGVCPVSFGISKPETSNTTASHVPTHRLPPSASPAPSLGLALGVSRDRAGQPLSPCESGAHGPDLPSCTAGPRPRVEPGEAERRRAVAITTPALL